MSKKKKKKNRVRIPPIATHDRHHICFQKRYWNKGYAKSLCMAFVRYVPVVYHREIHSLIKTIPVPDGALLREAWTEYQRNHDEIDSYGVARAAAWLYVHIPDPDFRRAMQVQIDFFTSKNLP